MTPTDSIRPDLDRWQMRAMIIGAAAAIVSIIGAFLSPGRFFQAYLMGYMWWIGIAVGSCAVVMLHHMVGGRWGVAIRRFLESATRTLPLMAVLLIPIFFGMHYLYEWTHADVVAHDKVLQSKSGYLNVPFFIARAVIYFAIWLGLAFLLNRYSAEQDTASDPGPASRRLSSISGPGLILYALTVTFASVDWVMSIEPHWFSTMYGILFLVGQGLHTFAFCVAVAILIARRINPGHSLTTTALHDLGNLMFAFTMLWAYVQFSQFLIMWSGNIAEEVPWYLRRINHGWGLVAIFLIVFHFMIPFVVLLMRDVKRRADRLIKVAIAIVLFRLVDLFWLVQPAFREEGLSIHWLDATLPVAIGGLWIAFFLWQLKARPLAPVRDPRIVLEHAHE
jgi:hypothetical protein